MLLVCVIVSECLDLFCTQTPRLFQISAADTGLLHIKNQALSGTLLFYDNSLDFYSDCYDVIIQFAVRSMLLVK